MKTGNQARKGKAQVKGLKPGKSLPANSSNEHSGEVNSPLETELVELAGAWTPQRRIEAAERFERWASQLRESARIIATLN